MILFDKIAFGPIQSRRLGVSLGVNLLPVDSKICNFNCIYCECGWTDLKSIPHKYFPDREDVYTALESKLEVLGKEGVKLDAITFAGNGEPTMHPQFSEIVDDTIELRDRYYKHTKIAVLSNAALLNNIKTVEALLRVDIPILKLDAGTEETFNKINLPVNKRSLKWVVDHLYFFKNKLTIQTMFLKGVEGGVEVDNTTDFEVNAWLKIVKELNPECVMIYGIDRKTPMNNLEKVPLEKLNEIAQKVEGIGIKTLVA